MLDRYYERTLLPPPNVADVIRTATNSILAQTQQQYQSELAKKQELINQQNTELRNIAAEYEQERGRLEEVQRKAKERTEHRQKIQNHQRHNSSRRARIEAKKRELGALEPLEPLNLAALGFLIETDEEIERIKSMDEEEAEAKLKLLPSKVELEARVMAHQTINNKMEEELGLLRERSSELEGKYRKVVSMCTGVPEVDVDGMLGALLGAVANEDGDMGRVREFLRRIEVTEG